MNIVIFIILCIIYFYLFFKIYNENKSIDGLKISIVLFILQVLSYIGNLMSENNFITTIGSNFTQFSGNLASAITQNFLVIIAVIIVWTKYKKQS